MSELNNLLKNTPTETFYKAFNRLLLGILDDSDSDKFYLDYQKYWRLRYEKDEVKSRSFFDQIRVEFKRDLTGAYYFNIGVEHHLSFGDHGYKTVFFSKEYMHYVNLLEWELIQEIIENTKKAKAHLIEQTKHLIREEDDPVAFIQSHRLRDVFK